MAVQRTLSIVKPDAVGKNLIGEIYSRFEKGGLSIIAISSSMGIVTIRDDVVALNVKSLLVTV